MPLILPICVVTYQLKSGSASLLAFVSTSSTSVSQAGVYRLPSGKVSWQVAPFAPLYHHVQNGVEDCPHLDCSWTTTCFSRRNQRFNQLELSWVQVAGVCFTHGSFGAVFMYLQPIPRELFYHLPVFSNSLLGLNFA